MAKKKKIQRPGEDERAIRRLIKFYTRRQDWFMVERLFNDLGNIFGGGENHAGS